MRRQQTRESPLAILTVCTGNICRSPLAEQMLRLRFEGDRRFEFASAGLHAVVGAPMDAKAAKQLSRFGGDPTAPRGEQLCDGHAAASDLILTMTLAQRDEVLRRYPNATRRTFTLAEFATLLERATVLDNDLRRQIARAAVSRASVSLTDAHDVPDPIDASKAVHASVANQIVRLVDIIALRLRGQTPTG